MFSWALSGDSSKETLQSFVGLYHNTGLCPSVEEFAEPEGFGREAKEAEVKSCLLAAVAGLKLLGCKR